MKYTFFLSNFNENFLDRFSKNIQISNFIRIRPVEAELFRAASRANMTKLLAIMRTCLKLIYSGLLDYTRLLEKVGRGTERTTFCVIVKVLLLLLLLLLFYQYKLLAS